MYQTLKLFSLTIIASLMLASCHLKNDLLDTLNQQDDKEAPCGITVTAVRMSCAGYGVFENVYFLTDSGKYLQPWELFPTFQAIPEIIPGKKYTIGYQEVKRDNRYDNLMRCRLYDERVEKATAIKLTCLVAQNGSADDEVACGKEVTAVPMSCAGYGAFGNVYFLTDEGEYIQPWEMFPTFAPVEIKPGKRYVIGYKKVKRDNRYQDLISCMLYDEKVEKATPVKLTCLSETTCANTEATVSDKRPVDGCLEFVLDNGERLLADISHLNIMLEDGARIRFAYTIEDGIIPCGTRLPTIGKVARIKCVEKLAAD